MHPNVLFSHMTKEVIYSAVRRDPDIQAESRVAALVELDLH
jgi:hypothetical protein